MNKKNRQERLPERPALGGSRILWPGFISPDAGPRGGLHHGTPGRSVKRPIPALGERANRSPREVLTRENTTTNRTPLLVFWLSGVFLLRLAERAFLELLFQEPPRNTRFPHVPESRASETTSGFRWKSVSSRMSVRNRHEFAWEA